jgi:tRNA-splicing ligase RtcB
VEWGVLELTEESKDLKLPKGKYLALLSHSGSRGFGAGIANHYSKLAMEKTKLPKEAQHLAWLDLNTEEGQEYWIGMNLAGEYASANHHQIHRRMAKAMGVKPVAMVENHHNFRLEGNAARWYAGDCAPQGGHAGRQRRAGHHSGSSGQPGFVVRGKGNTASLQSASHGAGRLMSRSKAMSTLDKKEVKAFLAEKGVTMIGGDLDEAPMVYKDIHGVIAAQQDLVDVLAKIHPADRPDG